MDGPALVSEPIPILGFSAHLRRMTPDLNHKQVQLVGRLIARIATASGYGAVANGIDLALAAADFRDSLRRRDPIAVALRQVSARLEKSTRQALASEFGPDWETNPDLTAVFNRLPNALDLYTPNKDEALSDNLNLDRIARRAVLAAARDDMFREDTIGGKLLFAVVRETYNVALKNKDFFLESGAAAFRETLDRLDEVLSRLARIEETKRIVIVDNDKRNRSLDEVAEAVREALADGRLGDADRLIDAATNALAAFQAVQSHLPIPRLSQEVFPEGLDVLEFRPREILKIRLPDTRGVLKSGGWFSLAHFALFPYWLLGPVGAAAGLVAWACVTHRGHVVTIKLRQKRSVVTGAIGFESTSAPDSIRVTRELKDKLWHTCIVFGSLALWKHHSNEPGEGWALAKPFVDALRAELGLPVEVADRVFILPPAADTGRDDLG